MPIFTKPLAPGRLVNWFFKPPTGQFNAESIWILKNLHDAMISVKSKTSGKSKSTESSRILTVTKKCTWSTNVLVLSIFLLWTIDPLILRLCTKDVKCWQFLAQIYCQDLDTFVKHLFLEVTRESGRVGVQCWKIGIINKFTITQLVFTTVFST